MVKKLFLMLLIMVLLTSCSQGTNYIVESTSNDNDYNNSSKLLIDLKGEVMFPNIYSIESGTTLYELIILAGGFTKNANTANVNLVVVLNENQMITIPALKMISDDINQESLININNALLSELCELPGIGTSKAQKIIDYRNNGGIFTTIDDIKNVSGIGEELFAKIKDYICV